jgi:hypothetical protein
MVLEDPNFKDHVGWSRDVLEGQPVVRGGVSDLDDEIREIEIDLAGSAFGSRQRVFG